MSSHGDLSGTWLASGHTPASWQHEMAQRTAWVHLFSSAYHWTQEFAMPQPQLTNEPILGRALALLTNDIARQAQSLPEATRPTRARPARAAHPRTDEAQGTREELPVPQTGSPYHGRSTFPGKTPSVQKKQSWTRLGQSMNRATSATLAQVDQRVDDVRLHQWARTLVGTMNHARTISSPPTQDSLPQPHRQDTRKGYPAGEDGGGNGNGDGASELWRRSLIEQTRRVLHHAYQPTIMSTEQEELLSQQWSTPIGEPSVPLELLQHFAALPGQESVGAHRNERKNDSTLSSHLKAGGIPEKSSLAGSDNYYAENGHSNSINALAQLLAGDGQDNSDTGVHAQTGRMHLEQRDTEYGRRAGDTVEQSMPPVVASQLPPLVPPQSIDMPPLPIAMATARVGARAEMVIEEDLDMLAAKIKHILDDEARRHGIDV
ncbi:MAG: hypothetical protein ABI396_09380 [Ktedonobacteraceae bacterium]